MTDKGLTAASVDAGKRTGARVAARFQDLPALDHDAGFVRATGCGVVDLHRRQQNFRIHFAGAAVGRTGLGRAAVVEARVDRHRDDGLRDASWLCLGDDRRRRHRRPDRAGALARADAQSVHRREPGVAEGGAGAAVCRLVRFRRDLEGLDRGDAGVLSDSHQHRAGREIDRSRLRRRDGQA